MNNKFILNDKDIGVSEIEFNKNGNLIITDNSRKYSLVVCIRYNKGDIENMVFGEKKSIDFNEYYISENNEPALLNPISSTVEKINERIICFDFNFDMSDISYMNKRKRFDIDLNTLMCRIYLDYI